MTNAIKNFVTAWALDPLQTLLDSSPWWLTFAALTAIAAIVGGRISALITAVCLALIIAIGLWQDTMDTLAAVLVATVAVVVLGVVIGVWMGRNRRADQIVRPFLDAAQTMPSFVYLVPSWRCSRRRGSPASSRRSSTRPPSPSRSWRRDPRRVGGDG